MRILVWSAAVIVTVLAASCVSAGGEQWSLVWNDDFDRAEVGSGWHVFRGKASIHDGRLLLQGGGAIIMTQRTFAPDVRLEFYAEAEPGLPPCDLSAAFGANRDHGYGYLLAFGGASNQRNQLLGPGVKQVVTNPPFVIEHGKVYHIVAQMEGKRLSYAVNGVKLLDTESTDPAGGPGFDRVGLVTWAGMLVDDVRVYERATPHPDTPDYLTALPPTPLFRDGRKLVARLDEYVPGLDEAVAAFNRGDLAGALGRFRAMGDTLAGLVGHAYVIGDLGYSEKQQFHKGGPTEDFAELAERFQAAAAADPSDGVVAAYSRTAASFAQLIMQRSGLTSAIRIVGLGPENNPFYHKARFYEARYHYWNGMEGGSGAIRDQARAWMAELKELWPEHTVLRQYAGEKVPWGEDIGADADRHPAWAAHLREAYARQIRIMERFFTERQAADGQLGGGYGDDVELMRTWMQIASISSASKTARAGIERLAEGVWQNELIDGYARDIGDIEHSAEPSADTLPTMLLLNYGDPLWVERNLRACKTIREVIMGIDKKGYPRFRSSEFGAQGVNEHPRAGGDTGYHARAMKHFIWQAWWGDPEAGDWFARWCEGWRAATMSRIGTKIAGFTPPTIWYPSGDINPPVDAQWHEPGWNYYGNMGGMVHDSFLCAYFLTRDEKFLQPFRHAMDVATAGPLLNGSFAEGSPDSQRQSMVHLADPQRTAIYKFLTGERVYDEYTLRSGDPAQQYRVNYDLEKYLRSFEHTARAQRHNLELQTTEVLSTDRAALIGATTVFGAYTGAVCGLRDAATPTFAVTYDTPDENFAALVTESTPRRVRVWLYSFRDEPTRIGLKFWQLLPGSYIMNRGELLPGESPVQNRYGWLAPRVVEVTHRGEGAAVTVPPGKVWVVDLRLETPIAVPDRAPDLAIGKRDLNWTAKGLRVTVHNIGNAASKQSTVALQVEEGGRWRTITQAPLPPIAAPRGFSPSTRDVLLPAAGPQAGRWRVAVDPQDTQYETCETNNTCEVEADGRQGRA